MSNNESKMRLAIIDFLEVRLWELKKQTEKETSKEVTRFTAETYLTTKKLLEKLKSEQETKAIQAAEDLWDQGF